MFYFLVYVVLGSFLLYLDSLTLMGLEFALLSTVAIATSIIYYALAERKAIVLRLCSITFNILVWVVVLINVDNFIFISKVS
jgi:hypothetical protein